MLHYCKVVMLGRATADPVTRAAGAAPVAAFGFVVNERFQDAQGTWQDRAMFIDCEAFGKLADAVARSVRRGRALLVEGRLRLDEWKDREGKPKRRHLVVLDEFRVIDAPPRAPAPAPAQSSEPAEPEPV